MRKQRGFTLIELLIVVAIIGIIAAIAIPNLLNAIHRGRQKRTMADMRTVGTALGTYATDNNFFIKSANYASCATYLSPMYIQLTPERDGWNTPMYLSTDTMGVWYTLHSYGKNKTNNGLTVNQITTEFNCDIGHMNGVFVQWPEGTQK
jgi:general secretion pathway protein G